MFSALLIALLIVAGTTTVIGGGLVLAARRKALAAGGGSSDQKLLTDGTGTKLLERGPSDLRTGDIIQYQGTDYLVEGTIYYDEAGHRWVAGRLVDGDDERWLVVGMERVGDASVRMMVLDKAIDIAGYPPEMLVVGKDRFRLGKRGTATAKANGDSGVIKNTGLDPNSVHRCRWWRYEGAGSGSVVVEQWGGEYRVMRGETVGLTDFEMMPGS